MEVKWSSESITTKLGEVMEFQLSYFKSYKMMLWKCFTQYTSKFGKLSSGRRTGKGQFSFHSQRKAMPKNVQTMTQKYQTITLISHASKVVLKILQVKFQQYLNHELPFKLDLEKTDNQRSCCQHLLYHWKWKRIPEKHLLLLLSCSGRVRLCATP